MPTTSPQQAITQSLTISRAQILELFSNPFILVPAVSGYINVFQKASFSYRYNTAPFTSVNNPLSFKIVPSVGDPIIVSNELNAQSILGISQSTTVQFSPANPYDAVMTGNDNAPLVLSIDTANPVGGAAGSQIQVQFTYSIFKLS
jgi:hypothetical protein